MDFASENVVAFQASLPPHQRLVPLTELNQDARATLRQCFRDAKLDSSDIDTPATPEEALDDMKTICHELCYLPPLCPPADVETLLTEMGRRDGQNAWAVNPYFGLAEDASGLVASPSGMAIRRLLADASGEMMATKSVFRLLTEITRQPEGSVAPGTPDGPPSRITLRELKAGTPSTLGEPKHTDVKATTVLDEPTVEGVVRRPRLIWTFDAHNPLRICSWRARASIETEAPWLGGGIVAPERIRCDPPFLHEGMTTDLSGATIGKRVQMVCDTDWFNVAGAIALFPPEQQRGPKGPSKQSAACLLS